MKTRKTFAIEKDSDGWWAWYRGGWKSAIDPVGACHLDHESTKREIMERVRDAIPCDCPDCQRDANQSPRQ